MTSPPPLVAAPAFALVRAPIAPMHAEPSVQSIQVTQTLFGHAPSVVDTDGDWHRLRTLDGYEGWTHVGYLAVLDTPTPIAVSEASLRDLLAEDVTPPPKNGNATNGNATNGANGGATGGRFDPTRLQNLLGGDAVPRFSLGCTVLAGERRLRLPLGAWVHSAQTLLDGQVIGLDELAVRFPTERDQLVRTAARWFEGTSYQWGGVTPWGADCSGLAQTVFGMHGISLPRDAWMQAKTGRDAGHDLAALEPADLLFFSDRPDRLVTHVAISAGAGRVVHLALGRGGFAYDDLLDENDPYARKLAQRFVCARRYF
ncbi:NLP/P60 protein [Gemmatirosa kalamazoonensis]|uniref:NLP/P60 protein n=1 Tax=Gemmatirosa kalamazoonensis TaxID=861299 RepID=W0RH20_9BACT|nr:C40 family peptidase [Gemmatirosa kalamazoonensis]AHG90086.1 NLP/P60 protein [Gemmatirosa kalamazoonensis]